MLEALGSSPGMPAGRGSYLFHCGSFGNEMGEPPTLLLDDVFSELDVRRRSALLKSTEGVQTLITCTDRQDAADAHADAFLRVSQGEDGKACLSPA